MADSIEQQFNELSLRFAQEFNTLRQNEMGYRSGLSTRDKTTLVNAINEIYGIIGGTVPPPSSEINDNTIGPITTWSSQKIQTMFNTFTPPAPPSEIDDAQTTTDKTWSSSKITEAITDAVGDASSIDDAVTGSDTTWSSQQITSFVGQQLSGVPEIVDTITSNLSVWSSAHTQSQIAAAVAAIPPYTLPTASGTLLGGIMIGQFLAIDVNGKVSVAITKGDIGLGNVENKSSEQIRGELTASDVENALGYTPGQGGSLVIKDEGTVVDSSATALNFIGAAVTASEAGAGIVNVNIPAATPTSIGLPNVENKSSAMIRAELTATDVEDALGFTPGPGNPLAVKDEGNVVTNAATSLNFVGSKVTATQVSGAVTVTVADTTKADVGLGNVDNQSAATIQAGITAANVEGALGFTPVNPNALGVSIATLVAGVVPASQLPSYVDDVLEFPTRADFPAVGETGKIYIDDSTNVNPQWRWTGTQYVNMVSSPGTTDAVVEGSTNLYFTENRVLATLLAGVSFVTNAAITAADSVLIGMGKLQAQVTALGARISSLGKADVGLGNVDNQSAATIQAGITSANVTNALSYTPSHQIAVQDEGVALSTAATSFNFVGTGVTATQTSGAITVSIPGGSSLVNTDALAEGSTNLYYTDQRVRNVVLTGVSFSTSTAVVATDNVLQAIGKLQAQASLASAQIVVYDEGTVATSNLKSMNFVGSNVSAVNVGGAVTVTVTAGAGPTSTDALAEGSTNLYFTVARVLASVLTGLSTATATAITAADNVLTAMGKLQAQITANLAAAVTLAGNQTLTNKTLSNATFSGYIESGVTGSPAANFSVDYTSGTDTEITTTQNLNIILPNSAAGRSYTITVIYGGAHTVTFSGGGASGATNVKYAGGTAPAATSVAGKRDYYVCKCDRAATTTSVFDGGRNF